MKKRQLIIRQLDKYLKQWLQIRGWYQPRGGWIHTIRRALGITTKQLAERLDVSRSRVIKIESDEVKGVLTMQTLIAAANALDCDFVYALVPRKPLEKMLDEQAQKVAVAQMQRISHSMLLENHSLTAAQNKEQIAELKALLLAQAPKKLWDHK